MPASKKKIAWPFVTGRISDGDFPRISRCTFLRFGEDVYWARYQWNYVPDFCGGLSINSPQVIKLRRPGQGFNNTLYDEGVSSIMAALPDLCAPQESKSWNIAMPEGSNDHDMYQAAIRAIATDMVGRTLYARKGAIAGVGPVGHDGEGQRFNMARVFHEASLLNELHQTVFRSDIFSDTPEEECSVHIGEHFINPNTARVCAWFTWAITARNYTGDDLRSAPVTLARKAMAVEHTLEDLFQQGNIARHFNVNSYWGVG